MLVVMSIMAWLSVVPGEHEDAMLSYQLQVLSCELGDDMSP